MNMSVQLRELLVVHLKDVEIKGEIKGALEVTVELHLKINMMVRLLVQKSSQNNLMKCKLEEALYVALEGARKISLSEAQKIAKKCEEKDAFEVPVDGSIDDAIRSTPLNLKFGFLSVLYIYIAQNKQNC